MKHDPVEQQAPLVFLKLGGSLITDKRQPEMPRLAVIQQLAAEIAEVRRRLPRLRILIGHGSGSFGHLHAKRHGTRNGVHTPEQWLGFAATADAAARLNRIVVGALLAAGVPAWSIQLGAALRCADGRIIEGRSEPVQAALARGLVPLVYGDVALDDLRGGTITSTEEIFEWLAIQLQPEKLVLAGEVNGIYTADPQLDPTAQRLAEVTPAKLQVLEESLGGSHGMDVTGGMASKVQQAMAMIKQNARLEIIICSGLIAGNLQRALGYFEDGTICQVGTRIFRD